MESLGTTAVDNSFGLASEMCLGKSTKRVRATVVFLQVVSREINSSMEFV